MRSTGLTEEHRHIRRESEANCVHGAGGSRTLRNKQHTTEASKNHEKPQRKEEGETPHTHQQRECHGGGASESEG